MNSVSGSSYRVNEPTKQIAFTEFLSLPETEPVSEYIDAQMVQKAATSVRLKVLKQAIDMNISLPFNKVKGAYSPQTTRCNFDGMSIVPDVCIFSEQRVFPDNNPAFIKKAKTGSVDTFPDWTIDFVSPDPDIALLNAKISGCLKAGTQSCWFIHVSDRQLMVYEPHQSPQLFTDDKTQLSVPLFVEGISLTVGTVFHWINL